MNERDSEALACLLEARGYCSVSEDKADVILLNTCSVRDQAERKVLGKAGLLKKRKRENPGIVIGIVGCMAQNHGRALLEKLPHVDLVVGTDRLHEIPEMIEEIRRGTGGLVSTESDVQAPAAWLTGHRRGEVSAYVSVMRGCNQFCSYCIVPYTRGREKSREIPEIVEEVEELVAGGTKEVLLLGQNITAYGISEGRRAGTFCREDSPFAELLTAVNGVSGLARIRFTSPHVRYMNDAFIETICTLPKVCKAFHIPLQSGSDRILKVMNRGYTSAEYFRVIQKIRERLDEVTFSTDIIVGFPGETEAEFGETRSLMREVGLDMAYIFRYSPRTGTKAAETLEDDIPDAVKMARNKILLDDLETGVEQTNKRYIGRAVEVLVEGLSRRNSSRWTGRTGTNKVCVFDPVPGLCSGKIVPVHITDTTSHSLFGRVLNETR